MADQKRIVLRSGHATPKTIVLHALPVADATTGTTIYLTETHATPQNIILRNPATAPVTGAETGESAAPLSAVATITAAGQKTAEAAAPLSAVATVTAAGQKGEDEAAPLSAVASITAAGVKSSQSAALLSAVAAITAAGEKYEAPPVAASQSTVGGVTEAEVELFARFLEREKLPAPKLYKKLLRVVSKTPPQTKQRVIEALEPHKRDGARKLSYNWVDWESVLRAGDAAQVANLINNAIFAAEVAMAEDDDEDDLLLMIA